MYRGVTGEASEVRCGDERSGVSEGASSFSRRRIVRHQGLPDVSAAVYRTVDPQAIGVSPVGVGASSRRRIGSSLHSRQRSLTLFAEEALRERASPEEKLCDLTNFPPRLPPGPRSRWP